MGKKKYGVRVWYKEETYVEVEAEDKEQAEEIAAQMAENGELTAGSMDEPFYNYEVEEL